MVTPSCLSVAYSVLLNSAVHKTGLLALTRSGKGRKAEEPENAEKDKVSV